MERTETDLNGKALYPVIDFDLVVNTDLGLIRFIRDNFQDSKVFDIGELNRSDREILSLLSSRTKSNPLSVISKIESEELDELYNSFMNEYKKEIIERSISDSKIYTMVGLMFDNGPNLGINGVVCIKDDIEKEEILNHFNKSKTILNTDKNSILSKDMYYVKDYRFFTNIGIENNVSHKKIYMSPLQYNIDYFEENDNALTSSNKLFLIGKDYRDSSKGENNHEQS